MSESNAEAERDPADEWDALPPEAKELFGLVASRRSARVGAGFEMPGGDGNPLAFESVESPDPLTLAEEAFIAMSGVGVTGFVNADLPLHDGPDGGGDVLSTLVGRAVASPDTVHATALVVINDDGVFYVRRPQNLTVGEVDRLIEDAEQGRVVDMYREMRVEIADERASVPRDDPRHTPTYNRWDHNRPGSTVFWPVVDTTALWIAGVTTPFENGFNVVDEHENYAFAGTKHLTETKGGNLASDPDSGKVVPLAAVEQLLDRMAFQEAGQVLAHMQLAATALRENGVGAFPAAMMSPAWFDAVDFEHATVPVAKLPGLRGIKKWGARFLGKTVTVPVGLESDGDALMTPYTPENYPSAGGTPSMDGAVTAFLDDRYGPEGALRNEQGPWKDNDAIKQHMKRPDDETIEAIVAAASYVYDTYGRFPRDVDPLTASTGVQAHRTDPAFYRRYYRDSPRSKAGDRWGVVHDRPSITSLTSRRRSRFRPSARSRRTGGGRRGR